MKKVLLAVDDTKGSKSALRIFIDLFARMRPEKVILLHVQQFSGKSVLHNRISDTDISALLEALKGTEIQEMLDRKSREILEYYKKSLEESGVTEIQTSVRSGHPAEEILKAADEENAELIILGSKGERRSILLGSVSREVAERAKVPVLIGR